MEPVPLAEQEVRRLLELARGDRRAARDAIAKLRPEAQLVLVCEAPLAERRTLLDLVPEPEALIPALPEAEFCFTVRAIGLADAAWMLEHATPEQAVAAIDLDAWVGTELDRTSMREWLQALADVPSEARLSVLEALDQELLVLALASRLEVAQRPHDDESWLPPVASHTLEGEFFYAPREEGDDLADVTALLHSLFQGAYWSYFRLMQGLLWEIVSDTEEWALRWRTGRLEDLGFPPWDEAMRIYRFLRPSESSALPEDERPLDVAAWRLPVWLPRLPETAGAPDERIFRAVARLEDPERQACFYAFIALANKVAIADRLPLGDASSTPAAIGKVARFASQGLAHLADENALEDVEVLRRVSLEHLFRVGANLDPASARP